MRWRYKMTVIPYIFGGSIFIAMYSDLFAKVKHGFRAGKYPDTSSFNPIKILSGKRWTSIGKLKAKLHKRSDQDFFIGYFRFSPKTLVLCKPPYLYRKYSEGTELYTTSKDMKQTTLIFGGMGSGKTVFLLNILEQITCYDNALIVTTK